MKGEVFVVKGPLEVRAPDSLSMQSSTVCADFPQTRQLKLQMQKTESSLYHVCFHSQIPHSVKVSVNPTSNTLSYYYCSEICVLSPSTGYNRTKSPLG